MKEVTALMSVYNGEKFIKESIQSILNQSYSNFELLIIDDCSTDNTVKVIKSIKDKRIRLIELKKNVGVGAALRYSLDFIDSKYVIKVDSDDINHKDRFILQKSYMDNNPDIALSKTLMDYFPDNKEIKESNRFKYLKEKKLELYNSVISSEDLSKYIEHWFCIPHFTIMIKTDVLKKIKYEPIRYGEDYTLFYTLNKLGYKMGTVEEVLVNCRVRDTSLTALGAADEKSFEHVFDLKKEAISNFLEGNKAFYIWGTGTLAKAFYNKLKEESGFNTEIAGFIDGTLEIGETKEFLGYSVYSRYIIEKDRIKVIVAASPALIFAINYLNSIGYDIGKDYYIYRA